MAVVGDLVQDVRVVNEILHEGGVLLRSGVEVINKPKTDMRGSVGNGAIFLHAAVWYCEVRPSRWTARLIEVRSNSGRRGEERDECVLAEEVVSKRTSHNLTM
jgi:hypothetical protein